LIQVIANLLNNAAKYTPQGGEIGLTVRSDNGLIEISVADSGIGIDSKLLAHVFDLFTQAERTPDRAQGGLGIGLALVKTMVGLHGGTIDAYSAGQGAGSTFTIKLPAASRHEGPPEVGRDELAPHARSVHVMIVDDNVDAGESLAALMVAQGHRVTVLAHPLEAISAASQDPPEVFILDIGLPDIDGYELVRRLRTEPMTNDAQFIALTGYGQAHDRVLSAAAGFDHHFVKPIDITMLNKILLRGKQHKEEPDT
jgi:CheY-like chemotaxis protein